MNTLRKKVRLSLGAAAVTAGLTLALAPAAAFGAAPPLTENGDAARSAEDSTEDLRGSIKNGPAKNVILLIGDGMGDSEITSARDYAYGAAGRLPGIDALPLTGQYTTYSLYKDGANKGKPDYVPDSAATGTAWATGTKTYDNAISVDVDGTPQDTLVEIAKANGLKTGNVSTAEIQDATPAVQAAHVDARSCYGPDSTTCGDDALTAGGLGSISEQILDTRADLTLGGGSTSFTQTAKAGQWSGEALFDQAEERGYQLVGDAAGLDGLATADQKSPVLGTFTPGNFPTRFAPTTATVGGADQAPTTCAPNSKRLDTGLSLANLTKKSIGLLDTQNSKGFFLQVEGASIDKQDHAADACGQIGEVLDLDEAVQQALAFAKADGNTMVIVTADHAHTSQIVDSTPPATLSTALTTADGTTLKIAYGTAAAGGSQQHTGSQLRVAGYGPGAANVVGLIDQTDNFFTISNALRLERNVDSLSAGATAGTDSGSTVRPGQSFTVKAAGFRGDRQLGGVVASDPVDLPRTDVIDGAAEFEVTAPLEEGQHTVTVTGAQSGKDVIVRFTVAASAGAGPGAGNGTGSGGGSSAGDPVAGGAGTGDGVSAAALDALAFTGSNALPLAALALALAGVGTVLVLRHRRSSLTGTTVGD